MSQNSLIEKIKKDAAQAVEEIKSAGSASLESIQREIEAEVNELTKSHTNALEKTKAQMELVAISKAKQAGNIAIQSAKRNMINAIFSEVVADLEGQDSATYVAFFKKYAQEIVPQNVEIAHVHAAAKRVTETEEVLKSLGLVGEVKADSAIKAGFVLHAKDGVYDVTLARLMNERRNELEMVIVNAVMS
jgi:vacuolar-type H+-ATPase subunit E/Vma4